jgi:predicted RNA-binding protein with PUA-like domain
MILEKSTTAAKPMSPSYWLIRFAPRRTSWLEIVARGSFTLRGVKNAVARKHLASMLLGDEVLFYQTEIDQAVMGILQVVRTAYPDPTSADPQWLTCDFVPVQSFQNTATLQQLRSNPQIATSPLIKQPRVAVVPLQNTDYKQVLQLSNQRKLP